MNKAPRMVANSTDTRPPKNCRTIIPKSPRRTDDPLCSRSDCIFLPPHRSWTADDHEKNGRTACRCSPGCHALHPATGVCLLLGQARSGLFALEHQQPADLILAHFEARGSKPAMS